MKQFNDKNFVLETEVAQDLYHNHAAKMPIIDYHCHLIPEMVAKDHKFKSITELWLGGVYSSTGVSMGTKPKLVKVFSRMAKRRFFSVSSAGSESLNPFRTFGSMMFMGFFL